MRTIVYYPDKRLRIKTPLVKKIDQKLLREIEDVVEVLKSNGDTAAGLASTQLGFESRFFAQKRNKGEEIGVYINPRIEATYGDKSYPIMQFDDGKQENFLEGCLSFPDLFGTVKRFLKIDVAWEEIEDGKLVTRKSNMKGFESIVFQHEAEHLDGILFVDHIKRDGGEIYRWVGNKKIPVRIEEVIKE